MRTIAISLATWIITGLAVWPGSAQAGAVSPLADGYYDIDSVPQSPFCPMGAQGGKFIARGFFTGSGTAGEFVMIEQDAPQPTSTSRNSSKIAVKQSQFSTLEVWIGSSDTGPLVIESCSVGGSVNLDKKTGSLSTSCKGSGRFAGLTADQVTSVQTAIAGQKNVRLKINGNASKWSLSIKCAGAVTPD